MSRTIRAQMPGLAFHITARTQGREPWFEPHLRTAIQRIITEGLITSDALLLSHCVMPNHFHLVFRQGSRPLGWVMQPIMRRVALLVQRAYGIEGHVFERRFRSRPCEDADHLRRGVVYSNLNPQRAGLCARPFDYAWSSHRDLMCDQEVSPSGVHVDLALNLFAAAPNLSRDQLRSLYLAYVAWRLAKDEHDRAGVPYEIPEPAMPYGDRHFADRFCALPSSDTRPFIDLRDKAMQLLAEIDRDLRIGDLRRRYLNRPLARVRSQLIAALLQCGYRGKNIADFLRISDSAVSRVATRLRYGLLL